MNIFYLSNDPVECAKMHVDKHCVKMILEYAQLLSTAHRLLDGKQQTVLSETGRKKKVWMLDDERNAILYAATHVNHPSNVWARASAANYKWLFQLFVALLSEYEYRYGRTHATSRLKSALASAPKNIAGGHFTQPTPAMPVEYIISNDSIQSYKNYYLGGKAKMFAWKKREMPAWISQSSLQ